MFTVFILFIDRWQCVGSYLTKGEAIDQRNRLIKVGQKAVVVTTTIVE